MLDEKKLIDRLNSLIHLDIDAVRAYSQAIDEIEVPEAKNRLVSFRADHERHIENLSALVRARGGQPPERKPDLKGFFIETFTAIRSKMGTAGALKAMRGNEMLTNRTYDSVLSEGLPGEIEDVVRRNRDDERRHLEYIERVIDEKIWEREERKAG